jgi:two-component system nitrate/nitrite response regulator NarL
MRALVVCRFPVHRDALARLVEATFGAGVVQSFAALQDALDEAALRPIDVLLIEVDPQDGDFGELRRAVEAVKPAPVALFATLSPAGVQAAYEAGAKGCVPKTALPELVAAALRLILAGGLYFSDFSSLSPRARADQPLRARLSSRQLEVLRLIELGQTNKEIAKALGISVATVKLHVQAILNVTGARNRTEAALRARGQFT